MERRLLTLSGDSVGLEKKIRMNFYFLDSASSSMFASSSSSHTHNSFSFLTFSSSPSRLTSLLRCHAINNSFFLHLCGLHHFPGLGVTGMRVFWIFRHYHILSCFSLFVGAVHVSSVTEHRFTAVSDQAEFHLCGFWNFCCVGYCDFRSLLQISCFL